MMKPSRRLFLSVALMSCCILAFNACEAKKSATEENSATTIAAAEETSNKLQIEDIKVGEGKEAKKGDTVSVHYTGTLLNGQQFDSSLERGEPIEFKLGSHQVIEGWEKGIAGMKEGGKRVLTIPPAMAYGKAGYPPTIPANATLKFDVELVKVQ